MMGDQDNGATRRRKRMGERIAQLRRQAGLTQADLSQLSDLTPRGVSDLENGLVHVPSPVLFTLCWALKVEIIAVFRPYAEHGRVHDDYAGARARSVGPH